MSGRTKATIKRGDRVYTPAWVAEDMVRFFAPHGRVLEPFRGGGVFTALLPDAQWCEIDEGRDFFVFTSPVDWIISNPPYTLTRRCFAHAFTLAPDVCFLVPLRNVFSAYGFVREILDYGGIPNIRVYGTGSRLGFPMGNAIGAIHCRRGYQGATTWTDQAHESGTEQLPRAA